MKKIKIFFILFTILSGLFLFSNHLKNLYFQLFLKLPEIEKSLIDLTKTLERKISVPPPLIGREEIRETFLTKEGIIDWTNREREKYGLRPLNENLKLNQSAELKLKDMFENQYFSHNSPLGKTLTDLITNVDYHFITIGENLAMGGFFNDKDLVESWMESPGHRANILNKKYQEIGVAVLKGKFQGKETWMAVQHFGLPLSVCPKINEGLKITIEKNKEKIEELKTKLDILEKEIKTIKPKRFFSYYDEKIKEYNDLVFEYNSLIEQTERLIKDYNLQVRNFNQCLVEFQ